MVRRCPMLVSVSLRQNIVNEDVHSGIGRNLPMSRETMPVQFLTCDKSHHSGMPNEQGCLPCIQQEAA